MVAPALIAGGASILGSVLGGKGQKKAASQAAALESRNQAANRQLISQIYQQNTQNMTPFMRGGQAAFGVYNALLGLNPAIAQRYQGTVPAPGATPRPGGQSALPRWNQRILQGRYGEGVVPRGGQRPANPQGGWNGGGTTPIPTAQNAFNMYRNSTGYQFRYKEGMRALNSGLAQRGMLDSGAAQKAALGYGQNLMSDEFGRYLGYLGGQQQMGMAGASALAGASQNFVNGTVGANNASSSALANAALIRGQANANMWGGIANGLGSAFGGGGLGSSYGGGGLFG